MKKNNTISFILFLIVRQVEMLNGLCYFNLVPSNLFRKFIKV